MKSSRPTKKNQDDPEQYVKPWNANICVVSQAVYDQVMGRYNTAVEAGSPPITT